MILKGIDSMDRQKLGSKTAKGGFSNEKNIYEKFLNWQEDKNAQEWLELMGYDYTKIKRIDVIHIPPRINLTTAIELGITKEKYEESIKFKKADIQIRLEILIGGVFYVENISLKKANKNSAFNQVDKRAIDTYQKMWNFNDNIAKWLKLFTGEYNPKEYIDEIGQNPRNHKRIFFSEMPKHIREEIIDFFIKNKTLVICDILKGRGGLSADWFLVTENDNNHIRWILKDINFVLNHYSRGDVVITPRGSLKIGRVTMQRKGGTPDPTSLQFKINPLSLFEE